jgi:hypothetical protein
MNISGEVVRTSQLPKKTLGLNDSLVALMSSPLETVTVPVSDFVSFVATQLLTANADSLDSVTTVGNTTANTITIGGATSPYYQLNTLSPGTQAVGRFVWNDVDGTVDLGLKGGNVTLQVGQETVVRVVNKTNANLLESEYKVVRVRVASEGGAQGQRLAVVLAQGNNDPDSVTTLGIVTENINNNQEGFITVFGNVNNINTTGSLQGETWADGDVLFLSPTTPGALTKVKPVAPNHTVVIGYVVYAHQNNGKIFVKVDNGYELEELHDVLPTPYVNNGVLYRDTTANLWRSATISTLLGYTPSNASGTTNYLSKFTGTTTLGNSLVYDNGTNVGIGTTSPTDRLHIVDASNANIFARVTANGTNASAAWVAQNDQVDNVVYRVFGSGATGSQMGISLARSASLLANLGGTGSFLVGTFSNTDFILGTVNTERARINTSGNFLIGTTTDAGYKLDVSGSTRVTGDITAGTGATTDNSKINIYGNNAGVSKYLRLEHTNSSTSQLVTDNTYLSLTAANYIAATKTLLAYGGVWLTKDTFIRSTESDNSYVDLMQLTSANLLKFGVITNISSNGAVAIYSNEVERVRIDSTGNVGIGTTTPSTILDVNANFNFNVGVGRILNIKANTTPTTVAGFGTGINFGLKIGSGAVEDVAQIDAVNNQLYRSGELIFRVSQGSTPLEGMRINHLGGLQIGTTTNAGYKLDVNGTARVSAFGVGITTQNASALLQVDSTTKGILGPRMTTAQILVISTPAEGLYVYNTDLKTLCFYNGTAWQKVTSTAM